MKKNTWMNLLLVGACGLFASACGGSGGACSGESSPGKGVCYDDWDQADCDQNQDEGVNGSDWTYHSGEDCEGLGYTYECSDGFRDNPCP